MLVSLRDGGAELFRPDHLVPQRAVMALIRLLTHVITGKPKARATPVTESAR